MRHRIQYFMIAVLIIMVAHPEGAFAQSGMIDSNAEYTFGERITFQAKLSSDTPVESAVIFFQAEGDAHTNVGLVTVKSTDAQTYQLSYVHNLAEYYIRPFSYISYRWEITPTQGEIYRSPSYRFFYEDNRFDWKTLDEKPFRVHWYQGNLEFAQGVLDVAQRGLASIQGILSLPEPVSLDIYIYSDSQSIQASLSGYSEDWVAGHADPDLGVVLVALPEGPEQRLLLEQRIPHELMHVMLFQAVDRGYANLPVWLNEGLASMAELYPSPDYRILLESAVEKATLLPMSSLCKTFPRDVSNAQLSYAEAASFTRYLQNIYGINGLWDLVVAYANGLDCDHGPEKALGKSLTELERGWQRDELSQNVTVAVLNNLVPWSVLFIAILVAPFILVLFLLRRKSGTGSTDYRAG
jgi:hypothetical protein